MSIRQTTRAPSPFQPIDRANKIEFSFRLKQDRGSSANEIIIQPRFEVTPRELACNPSASPLAHTAQVDTHPIIQPTSTTQGVSKRSFSLNIKFFVIVTTCGFGVFTLQ